MTESEPTPQHPGPTPLPEPLDGRALRSLTRDAARSHTGSRFSELFDQVYSMVLMLAIAGIIALGVTQTLNAQLRAPQGPVLLDPSWLGLLLVAVALGQGASLVARLGPAGLAGGQASWWLPTPADRRGLILPRLRIAAAAVALAGAAAGVLGDQLAGGSGVGTALAALVGGVGGLAVLAAAGSIQVRHRRRGPHPLIAVGEAVVALAPPAAVAIVLLRWPALAAAEAPLLAVAAGVLAVVALLLWRDTTAGVDRIPGGHLRASGAAAEYVAGALTSLDTRELGRALGSVTVRDTRRKSRRFRAVRGPVTALVVGDALLTLRSRRHVITVIVTAAVPTAAVLAGWEPWMCALLVAAAGYAAALASSEGARNAEMAPVLDRAFPMSPASIRRARLLWPASVMALWTMIVLAVWVSVSAASYGWIAVGALAGVALAAGAVRAAYRRAADWSRPLVHNPFGPPIPLGIFDVIAKGPDIVVLGVLPLMLGMILVASPSSVVFWQVAATAVAVAIAARVPSKEDR